MRCNKTDDDFKFDVWEEKCDISFKDQSIWFFHSAAGTFANILDQGIFTLAFTLRKIMVSLPPSTFVEEYMMFFHISILWKYI